LEDLNIFNNLYETEEVKEMNILSERDQSGSEKTIDIAPNA
jgi:hypothetical protein